MWWFSQSPACRIPQVHNRKRDSNFWEIYLALFFFFSSYLIKYICKHPNKGAIKYFTMHFFPNSSQKLKLSITLAHAVEKNNDKRMSEGLPSASKGLLGTFLPLSNMQSLSCSRLLLHFFHILMPYKTAAILQWLHTSGCFKIIFSIFNMRELVNK